MRVDGAAEIPLAKWKMDNIVYVYYLIQLYEAQNSTDVFVLP